MDVVALVTGGRDYADRRTIYRVLDALKAKYEIVYLVHGDARGADKLAHAWALSRGVQPVAMEALWRFDGIPHAGPKRNARMLCFGRPLFVVAFPGGRGTANMMRLAYNAEIPVYDVEADEWTKVPEFA